MKILYLKSDEKSRLPSVYLTRNAHISHELLSSPPNPQRLSSPTQHVMAPAFCPTIKQNQDELLESVWNSIKPYAVGLRKIIMTSPPPAVLSSISEPSPAMKTKMPTLATRRAACTHVTMERLYGLYRCNICHRPSDLGWVYCCTQDDEKHQIDANDLKGEQGLPEVPEQVSASLDTYNRSLEEARQEAQQIEHGLSSESDQVSGTEATHRPQDNDPECLMPTAQLNPWMKKAISDGHYTPEQVAKLRAQKQKVVDTANAAVTNFQREESRKAAPSDTPSKATTLPSVDTNPHLLYPILTEVQEPPSTNTDHSRHQKLKMFPYCKFLACHACRATYRDRAWVHFHEVFALGMPIPTEDIYNYVAFSPVADAAIVRKIGLRKPKASNKRHDQLSESYDYYIQNGVTNIRNYAHHLSNDLAKTTDVADAKAKPESKGFRESMKRAIKQMLNTRRESSRSSKKSRVAADEDDGEEFDMGLWKDLNDQLLGEASSVPLPRDDGKDGLGVGEEEVDIASGVAVTEEAAATRTADVIMSI